MTGNRVWREGNPKCLLTYTVEIKNVLKPYQIVQGSNLYNVPTWNFLFLIGLHFQLCFSCAFCCISISHIQARISADRSDTYGSRGFCVVENVQGVVDA